MCRKQVLVRPKISKQRSVQCRRTPPRTDLKMLITRKQNSLGMLRMNPRRRRGSKLSKRAKSEATRTQRESRRSEGRAPQSNTVLVLSDHRVQSDVADHVSVPSPTTLQSIPRNPAGKVQKCGFRMPVRSGATAAAPPPGRIGRAIDRSGAPRARPSIAVIQELFTAWCLSSG